MRNAFAFAFCLSISMTTGLLRLPETFQSHHPSQAVRDPLRHRSHGKRAIDPGFDQWLSPGLDDAPGGRRPTYAARSVRRVSIPSGAATNASPDPPPRAAASSPAPDLA